MKEPLGNDTIDGGAGSETMQLLGKFADYVITYDPLTHKYTLVDTVSGRDRTDIVHAVELFVFADGAFTAAELVGVLS
jgi:hypothetical protein